MKQPVCHTAAAQRSLQSCKAWENYQKHLTEKDKQQQQKEIRKK